MSAGEFGLSSGHIGATAGDGLLEVVLSRPEKLNAITSAMLSDLRGLSETFEAREDLRVMLLRGEGRYFSAGADLGEPALEDFGGRTSRARRYFRRRFHPLATLWETIEKPIVVAHHGPVLGGGLELSLSCDFRLAAVSACYGLPESAIGVMPSSGGVGRLTRLIGPHWARWLVMTPEQFDAEEALRVGLVHAVWPDEEFADRAREFCRRLVAQPPEMMAATKVAIELAADLGPDGARRVEQLAGGILLAGEERHAYMQRHLDRQAAKKAARGPETE